MEGTTLIPTWLHLSDADDAIDTIKVADCVVGSLSTALVDGAVIAHHLSLPEPGIHRVYDSSTWDVLGIWSDVQVALESAYGAAALAVEADEHLAVAEEPAKGRNALRRLVIARGQSPCASLTVACQKGAGPAALDLMARITLHETDVVRVLFAPVEHDRSIDQLVNHASLRAIGEVLQSSTRISGGTLDGICAVRTESGEATLRYRAPSPSSEEARWRRNVTPSSSIQSTTSS